jgi:ligand-binding SRPBCC domain-containing protein
MKVFKLERTQILPISIEQAWEFFSSPKNLSTITPDYMDFQITNEFPDKMIEGTIITYKVKPLLGIPITWVTEITHINEPFYFVDEQRFGPYRMWHHQHFFKEIDGGVEMKDVVNYVLPFGFFGNLAHSVFVNRQLNGIFDYRYETLEKLFAMHKLNLA